MVKGEPKGHRKKINIRLQRVLRNSEMQYAIDPCKVSAEKKRRMRKWKSIPKFFQGCYIKDVPTKQVDTKEKLALFVRNHGGFGEFNVLIGGKDLSKRYNPKFVCRKGCKRRRNTASCKHNKRMTWACHPRATIIIKPNEEMFATKDFTYRWIKKSDGKVRDKMYKMWYWNDDDKPRKERKEEDRIKDLPIRDSEVTEILNVRGG